MKMLPALFAALVLAVSAPAMATELDSYQANSANATALCHTALPAYDAPVRFRPLAVSNEGEIPAFVTCSFVSPSNSDGVEWFGVTLKNLDSAHGHVDVTCTAVVGYDNGAAQYMVQTSEVSPMGRHAVRWRFEQDNGGQRWTKNVNVSCLLPPGVAINEVSQGFRQI